MNNNTTHKDSDAGEQSYLESIVFRAEDYGRLLRQYVTNMRLVILLFLSLIIAGIASYITLPRTLNPEIGITIVTVSTVLPGATPEDTEQLLLDPIEDELAGVDDVDVMTGTAGEGSAVVVLQFNDGVDAGTAMADVRDAVGSVGDLPEDATTPVVRLVDFEDAPILRYAVLSSGDAVSRERTMARLADRLEDIDLVDRIVLGGTQTQEVQIIIDERKRAALGVSVALIHSVVTESLQALPAGTVYSDTSAFGLTIDRTAWTLDDVRALRIVTGGVAYTLGDIATVQEAPEPGSVPALMTTADGITRGVATIDVYRTMGSTIADAARATESVMREFFPDDDGRYSYLEVTNVDRDINEQFTDLVRNLSMTVGLVFLVLLLFVGVRQASVAAISVPLVFLAAFIAMRITGISLNFLSFFSLLLALGLLVDVTIVIVSAMTSYFRSGRFSAEESGLLVWKDYIVTLSITTLTTVWAFIPLLLASGIMGEYLKPIPIIVSSMLVASVGIGFLLILPLMVWLFDISFPRRVRILVEIIGGVVMVLIAQNFIRHFDVFVPWWGWIILLPLTLLLFVVFARIVAMGLCRIWRALDQWYTRDDRSLSGAMMNGFIDVSGLEARYKKLLTPVITRRRGRRMTVAMVVIFFVFSLGLLGAGFVPGEFFPSEDQDQIYVHVELAQGTKEEAVRTQAEAVIPELFISEDVIRVQTQVGYEVNADGMPATGTANNILYTIDLTPGDERAVSSQSIAQMLRDTDALRLYPYGRVTVVEIGSGPPAGADVTVKLIGDDMVTLNQKASEVIDYLSQTEGVTGARMSITPGTAKIVFVPNEDAMRTEGVSLFGISEQMRLFGNGITLDEDVNFTELSDQRDVVLRTDGERARTHDIETMTVTNGLGAQVPLGSLGVFELRENPTRIEHEDGNRLLTIEASVLEGYNANQINQGVAEFADTDLALPEGYTWATGGANEENQESVNSIMQAMVLAVILIFLTLIVQLRSYRKSFIVLLVIPPAISGVFFMFALLGMPLSFPALIGVLALFGIVINNSIIIIDQINKNRAQGLAFQNAVIDGAASRLDPILMSSMTTIVGLLPITLSEPVWRGLGGAIIAGLMFSGIIMLFFIPTVYYMMFEKEERDATR